MSSGHSPSWNSVMKETHYSRQTYIYIYIYLCTHIPLQHPALCEADEVQPRRDKILSPHKSRYISASIMMPAKSPPPDTPSRIRVVARSLHQMHGITYSQLHERMQYRCWRATVCMRVCVCSYCACACACACAYAYAYASACACARACARARALALARACGCVYVCVCVRVSLHMHTHTHKARNLNQPLSSNTHDSTNK